MAACEIGKGIGSFAECCDGCRDLVKGIFAGPLQDLGTQGAASIERAMPVAGDFNIDFGYDWVITAEGVMPLNGLVALVDEHALITEAAPRNRVRSAFTALAAFRSWVTRRSRRLIVEDLIKLEKTGVVELVQLMNIGFGAKIARSFLGRCA